MAAPNYQADLRSGLHGVQVWEKKVTYMYIQKRPKSPLLWGAHIIAGGSRDRLQPRHPGREDGPRGMSRGHGRGSFFHLINFILWLPNYEIDMWLWTLFLSEFHGRLKLRWCSRWSAGWGQWATTPTECSGGKELMTGLEMIPCHRNSKSKV